MSIEVPVKVQRFRVGTEPHFETYKVSVPDDANVIDVIEGIWSQHDRTFMFRHACHHASCGTCAVRLNGRERLPCIVPVTEALKEQPELLLEPLRNLPLVGDLVVDVGPFFQNQAASGMQITRTAEETLGGQPYTRADVVDDQGQWQARPYNRFENCIECGMCISACPTMAATTRFWGPAALAALYRAGQEANALSPEQAGLADDEHAVWRCHSAYECTEVCPQAVDPSGAIMALRRQLISRKVKTLFGG